MVISDKVALIFSLLPSDGLIYGFEDLSRLICFSDGCLCGDYVHCLRFEESLFWVCPRFKRSRSSKFKR